MRTARSECFQDYPMTYRASFEPLEPRTLMAAQAAPIFDPSTAVIAGTVYFDSNVNSKLDPREQKLGGWTVFIDTNRDGIMQSNEPATVSDVNGRYAFSGLPKGTY